MYDFLIGTVKDVFANYFSFNVAGVGFRIFSPNPYEFEEGQHATVFVEQIVRDNDISLYGFKNQRQRDLFVKLLDVSGIGPKSALAILASGDQTGLVSAVEQGQSKYLTKFPGIGNKTAQQIVLDLKGKLADFQSDVEKKLPIGDTDQLKDALDALTALGFSSREVKKVADDLRSDKNMSTDKYIQKGLKLLTK
ncbi:Holliday junction branch migration protein RuvA [Oenococcus alcoholitolerans]|uniref:Holliday junction branch migration protein RuvA n=1 Tax=Oenococcus alcoholitolerans TaxID=931074 RepID=UPI003F731033